MARLARLCAPVALGLLAVTAAPTARAYAAQVSIAETGSTLIYPVFRVWAADYPKTHPGVTVTAAATDSGAGVEQAISGAAQIGVSDAYMSDTQVRDNPLVINVPMAISAQMVNFNIPDLNGQNLKLDGSFHALKVTLKARSNVEVQVRKGYYAPRRLTDDAETAKTEIEEALFSRRAARGCAHAVLRGRQRIGHSYSISPSGREALQV